jgi:signal transduction histidine kinase
MLRGLPASMPEGMRADIALILREAVTNAVKHGKAGTVVFTADPVPPDGFSIRVLNDGAPFDVERALGPETGHYGLSGMKERALRNRLSLSWGRDGRWTYVRISTERDNT